MCFLGDFLAEFSFLFVDPFIDPLDEAEFCRGVRFTDLGVEYFVGVVFRSICFIGDASAMQAILFGFALG